MSIYTPGIHPDSPTTSNHQRIVRSAVARETVFDVPLPV